MSTSSDVEEDPPSIVCVVDTCVLVDLKSLIRLDRQWAVLNRMSQLVDDARLTFPRQVYLELSRARFPDAPGAWCGDALPRVQYPDPTDETMAVVLQRAADLVEKDAESSNEPADPYVLAQAYELEQTHGEFAIVVATKDNVDRLPRKIALTTACERFGIACWDPEVFLRWVASEMDDPDVKVKQTPGPTLES